MGVSLFKLSDLVDAINFVAIKSTLGSLFLGMAGIAALIYAARKVLSNAR